MPQNLILRTGTTNIQNITKTVTTPIVVSGTSPMTKQIATLPISLNNVNSSVLISAFATCSIADTAVGNPGQIGPVFLQVTRPINGVQTTIYQTKFEIKNIAYTANLALNNHFGFEWLDVGPSSSMCPDICSTSTSAITCPGTTITYTFNLYTPALVNATQTIGLQANDLYCFTLMEVLNNNQ
ncbi:hypothetical protein CBC_A0031 [Clostridium botulinum C str. Eklund]|nr:hypothetical protein CBC_A0031 [Clostridium botulinum C str. Eklund]NEZ48840.1 hypothetical protein [Clostridium botulinum]